MPGEFDFIRWLRTQQKPSDLVPLPAGDDMAVLRWPAPDDLLLVGVDQVLDGVHFDSAVHSPRAIGRKVMNRNLSDCAAMACLPAAAVIAVGTRTGTQLVFLQELYNGIREAGDVHGCAIIGGDTGSWNAPLVVSVTVLGRSAGITPVTRAGARPGDGIFVTGPLGGSLLGRHMSFEPRIAEGRRIAQAGATAMIDLSDGVSRDLSHICDASGGVGAILDASAIPIHADANTLSARDGRTPLEHALHDGEDYELLFTCPPDTADLPPDVARIGQITAEPGIFLSRNHVREPLVPRGWEHSL
jgi:thiamine-monophosphate kinase